MRFGIIAEGAEDQAVIRNILSAFKIDRSDIIMVKPRLNRDATDENNPTIGTFQGVKNACEGVGGLRPDFDDFFFNPDHVAMIIHLDTAEIDTQGLPFLRPVKKGNPNYCTELRNRVIELINSWLDNNYQNQVIYAIAIEEIEAWCLTLHTKNDTSQSADAKSKFWREVNKKKIKNASNLAELTQDFRKLKTLKTCFPYNQSLKDFADSVEQATQAFNS